MSPPAVSRLMENSGRKALVLTFGAKSPWLYLPTSLGPAVSAWRPVKHKTIHSFSHRGDKVVHPQPRSGRWGDERSNREKKESTERSACDCQSKTKRSGEERRLALAQDQSLEVAVAC